MKRILSSFTVMFLLISFTPSAYSTSPNLSEIAFQEFETDKYPFSMVTSNGQDLWIASWYKNSVSRFDIKSGSYTDSVSVGVNPVDLTLNNDNLWVLNFEDQSISVINIKTKTVVNTIILPNAGVKITSGGKYVWVQLSSTFTSSAYFTKSRILKFDGLSGRLLSNWDIRPCSSLPCSTTNFIDGEISAIAANNSSSWFCYREKGKNMPITKINSATDSTSSGLQTPQNCGGIWANNDYLAIEQNKTVYIYDARDLKSLGSVSVSQSDGFIEDLVFTEDSFYLSVYDFFRKNASTYLYDFDIKNMKLNEKIELTDIELRDFVVTGDQVWAIGITQSQNGSTSESKLVNFTTFKFRAKVAADKAAAELKAKQEADAKAAAEKAAAELKAKQEADAKAKLEAEAKAVAELKAKQEADAKAAADKAAAELKAKQEAEAKAEAAADKAAAELKAKQEAAAKAAAAKKKTTITCIKGKLTKKVTAVKPVCPKGYKKK